MRLCLGTHLLCPVFLVGKMFTPKTDTFLAIENWAWRADSRHQHEQNHQRQPDRQRKQNTSNIETGFPTWHPMRGRCRDFAGSARRFASVLAVSGHAAALGHSPNVRAKTF